jgi:hypothetical protein
MGDLSYLLEVFVKIRKRPNAVALIDEIYRTRTEVVLWINVLTSVAIRASAG